MTEEEKGVLDEAEGILAEALKQEMSQYKQTTKEALVLGELNTWKQDPLDVVYDLWVFGKVFVGTPEELNEWRKAREEDPATQHVETSAIQNGTANACVQLTKAMVANERMPENVNELLGAPQAMFMVHDAHERFGEVCGLMIRTKAFASQTASDTGKKPSESDDKFDVTVCASIMDGVMCFVSRRDDNGELLTEPQFVETAEWRGDNAHELKECMEYLSEHHGGTAGLLFGAMYLPIAMKAMDPELYEAAKQDFLASAKEESNTQPQEKDNDNQ
jgi:hypothetical protein